jgi:hypothetical protein
MHAIGSKSDNRSGHASRGPISVVTCRDFSAPCEAVWAALLFFEEISESLPFLLRALLPRPTGTEGCKSEVGGEVKCRYVGGHLVKRVTRVIHGRSYSFEVVEQNLGLAGIRLLGGDYMLGRISTSQTRVALATRYESPNRPRWLCARLEAAVCHLFHRHILSAMGSYLRIR